MAAAGIHMLTEGYSVGTAGAAVADNAHGLRGWTRGTMVKAEPHTFGMFNAGGYLCGRPARGTCTCGVACIVLDTRKTSTGGNLRQPPRVLYQAPLLYGQSPSITLVFIR